MSINIFKKTVNLSVLENNEPEEFVPCGTCTKCCELLSPYLTREEIELGIYPISLINPDINLKTQDPDLGPIIVLQRKPLGGCALFIDGKCSIYDHRPKACRQFDCRKGHHPKLIPIAVEKFGINFNEG